MTYFTKRWEWKMIAFFFFHFSSKIGKFQSSLSKTLHMQVISFIEYYLCISSRSNKFMYFKIEELTIQRIYITVYFFEFLLAINVWRKELEKCHFNNLCGRERRKREMREKNMIMLVSSKSPLCFNACRFLKKPH